MGLGISNRVRRRVKLVNYSLITALPIATSADPHIRLSAFYPWPAPCTPTLAAADVLQCNILTFIVGHQS